MFDLFPSVAIIQINEMEIVGLMVGLTEYSSYCGKSNMDLEKEQSF